MACQICNSQIVSSKLLIQDYEYNSSQFAEYKTCKVCTVQYRNKLRKVDLENLYTKDYVPVAGGLIYDFLKKIYANYEWKNIKKLNKELEKPKANEKKLLDIACGKGFLIEKISENIQFKCFGIDINQDNINKKKNLSFYKKSFSDFNFIKKLKPDFIILNNFIEHIEDLEKFDGLLEIMNNKSYLVIITPDNSGNAKKVFGKYWSGYHSPRHTNIFNKKSIQFFLEKKKLHYNITNIYDPLATISSIKNIFTDLISHFSFKKLLILFLGLINSFKDMFCKNRILIICKKK